MLGVVWSNRVIEDGATADTSGGGGKPKQMRHARLAKMLNKCSAKWTLLACLIIFSTPLTADPDAKASARKAALEWLALVDSEQYSESWNEAASLFKVNVSRKNWVGAIQSARRPLGAMQSRSFLDAVHETELPGMPDGKYVVIRYQASFENKADAVETITPMLDRDGLWRVCGYFVR